MIAVIVEWNTDENSQWVDEKDRLPIDNEEFLDYPLSIMGPFKDLEAADEWMSDALEDNTDVLDMYSVDREFPKGWFIAKPEDYPDGYARPNGPMGNAALELVIEPPMPIERPVRSAA